MIRSLRLLMFGTALALAACGKGGSAPDLGEPEATATAAAAVTVPDGAPVILAFGDSLYAGYQLPQTDSFPAKLQDALNRSGHPARVVNAGVSGDTTADGLQRLAFTLDNQKQQPALVLVGLGGNDMLRGLPPAETRRNLTAILDELKRRKLPVMLTGMLAAPNMGADYVQAFNPIYPALAKQYGAPLVPFLLQPIIDHPEWMLADRIHPNSIGVDKVVESTVDKVAGALDAAVKTPR